MLKRPAIHSWTAGGDMCCSVILHTAEETPQQQQKTRKRHICAVEPRVDLMSFHWISLSRFRFVSACFP